jgi:hypothetical protein
MTPLAVEFHVHFHSRVNDPLIAEVSARHLPTAAFFRFGNYAYPEPTFEPSQTLAFFVSSQNLRFLVSFKF